VAYTSTTRATLRARLQDRYTGDPYWSTVEANDALNESLRQFNLFTGYWRGNATAPTVINTPFVVVPGTLTYRTRVTRVGKALTRKSIVELYRSKRNWRTQTTASGSPVPTTIQEWAPVGLSAIAIWPTDAVGGTVLTFEAVKLTPVLTADGQFVDIGDEELKLVLDEALYVLSFKLPSVMEQMKPKHMAFLAGCLERNDQMRASSYYRRVLGLDAQQRVEATKRLKDDDGTPGAALGAGT
jgi:hypothetical protein